MNQSPFYSVTRWQVIGASGLGTLVLLLLLMMVNHYCSFWNQ